MERRGREYETHAYSPIRAETRWTFKRKLDKLKKE